MKLFKSIIILAAALIFAAALPACTRAAAPAGNPASTAGGVPNGGNGGIPFVYFYRGFTPIPTEELPGLSLIEGTHVVQTEDDWQDLMRHYCPGIPYYLSVDFTKESLIFQMIADDKPYYNQSQDVLRVAATGGYIDIVSAANVDTGVYAFNPAGEEYVNFFINVVKVNNSDLPGNIVNLYKK